MSFCQYPSDSLWLTQVIYPIYVFLAVQVHGLLSMWWPHTIQSDVLLPNLPAQAPSSSALLPKILLIPAFMRLHGVSLPGMSSFMIIFRVLQVSVKSHLLQEVLYTTISNSHPCRSWLAPLLLYQVSSHGCSVSPPSLPVAWQEGLDCWLSPLGDSSRWVMCVAWLSTCLSFNNEQNRSGALPPSVSVVELTQRSCV